MATAMPSSTKARAAGTRTSQPTASGKSRSDPRRVVSSPGTAGKVSVMSADATGPNEATTSAGAGPATATSSPPTRPPMIRPVPNVSELRPMALASRPGSTIRPAMTRDGADQKPSSAPTAIASTMAVSIVR